MNYKAIIFDFDGVILDSVNIKTLAFEAIYLPHGREIAEKVKAHHLLNGGISRFKKFRYYHQNFLGIELTDAQVDRMAEEFSELVFQKVSEAAFIKGAASFLEAHHDSRKCFIATGTPQNEIEQIVAIRNLGNYFVSVHGSPTSKEDIIEEIMTTHELSMNDVIFVGDAMTDYHAAEAKNLTFVGVANKNTLFPTGTKLINDLMELEEII